MLVSWEGFDEKHSTWEPVENLPTEMVEAFRNRRKKQTKQPKKGLEVKYLKCIQQFLYSTFIFNYFLMMKVFISSQDKKYISYVTIFE